MSRHQQDEDSLLRDPRFWVLAFAISLFVFRVMFGSQDGITVVP